MTDNASKEYVIDYIDTDADLATLCQHFADETVIAVDTEFHRTNTYFPRLCLIQLASSSKTACIDPFHIKHFEPLKKLFENPDIIKIFHSCKQDYEVLYQTLGSIPAPLFDSQVAASCLGMGQQIGYANLVRELFDIQLDKSQTRTDWTRRPLKAAQLQYAAEDVVPLLHLYAPLSEKLDNENRRADFNVRVKTLQDEEQYKTTAAVGAKKYGVFVCSGVSVKRQRSAWLSGGSSRPLMKINRGSGL